MSDEWNPFSDDGKRMISRNVFGYAIYSLNDGDDPKAELRNFVHRGRVDDFDLAQQWIADGVVRGPVVPIYMPKLVKVKSGAA